ncbi:ABC-2 type transport system ATP-binding protein [Caminicella sporogenes DSM 14501]|uniref:ABC-2 type transport system ATP-binding protein n=1 Tax=Caminicella sporogenes DSM 14501 TaxID=1121266 RepID=A0A1M6NK75_9FIRM|nr:ABC transporter ATP-binding protein [Caminicella sporogenes]RKD22172.1 hypothetical protein BET04_06000 [Caminicella sporogenes]SHJ96168.1 ABC-2 type transport system ATP-binding protein [Caminicella sporogenes DSM 14501]
MIEVKNLVKLYKNVTAIQNISINFEPCKVTCILGPNGSGKTTLIKSICGLLDIDEGSIYISGLQMNEKNRSKIMSKIGCVFDGQRNLYWRVTVLDNFYYFGTLKGVNMHTLKNRIDDLINKFEIKSLLNRKVGTLSLGERQKVSLITAILHRPEVLILDEPTNGLDIVSKKQLVDLINMLKTTESVTIIITSHESQFMTRVSDNYIFLKNGIIQSIISEKKLTQESLEKQYIEIYAKEGG